MTLSPTSRYAVRSDLVALFASAGTAERLVAGVPAAARVAHQLMIAQQELSAPVRCTFVVADGWQPSPRTRAEMDRLAPGLSWNVDTTPPENMIVLIRGEALPQAVELVTDLGRHHAKVDHASLRKEDAVGLLRRREREILRATAKPQDGIVSRTLNRPVSRLLSTWLLRLPGMRPWHATIGTALLGLAMAFALFFNAESGLLAGALLFQAASMFDGVDGEMARATFRTSQGGATADSIVDALTNFAFIGGLSFNLGARGDAFAAGCGLSGLVLLAAGTILLGHRARTSSQPIHFDAVKNHLAAKRSPLMQGLIWITMRDFYAAAGALAVLLGYASEALLVFCVAAAIWLAVTCLTLLKTRRSRDSQMLGSSIHSDV